MAKQINARIITKHDSAANWAKAINFVPKEGELIVYEPESVNGGVSSVARLKVGDGVNKISNLKFITAPYVEKQNGYGLSKNDFTDNYKNLLDEFLQIDNIKFTDTTYVAVENGGLYFQKNPTDNFSYNCFNTGLLSVKYDENTGNLVFGKYDDSGIGGHIQQNINLGRIIQKDVTANLTTYITSGESNGTISVNNRDVAVKGLGELAFEDKSFIDDLIIEATGEKEVCVGTEVDLKNERLWIDLTYGDDFPILKYRVPNTNAYYEYPSLKYSLNPSTPWKITLINNESYEFNTGIFASYCPILEDNDLNGFIQPGNYCLSDSSLVSTIANCPADLNGSNFRLVVMNNSSPDFFTIHQLLFPFNNNAIYYRICNYNDDNTFSWTDWINLAIPDNFLKLSGGTVTGTLTSQGLFKVTNTTASSSTSTGAAVISGGLGVGGKIYGDQVFGAVWNDYAEYRSVDIENPGFCVADTNDGIMKITNKRLMPCCKIITDTYGFAIGKTEEAKVPVAISGRVLVHTFESKESFEIGDCVCSGPNGLVSKMTREEIINYPDRIVGIVSEIPNYSEWGENNIAVNNRIWIYVR